MTCARMAVASAGLLIGLACSTTEKPKVEVEASRLRMFKPLPAVMESAANPITEEKVALGRMLYYETRLSKAQDVSCNTCHPLDKYGADGEPTSDGHKGQRGVRNSPTVYNAAGHFVQFWDGRAPTVEEQAKGPVMNPVEMAMPSERHVIAVLKSIPEYVQAFQKAFPGEKDPVTYDNMALAIGAFERRLVTPGRWDSFLAGDASALAEAEKVGFNKFVEIGCHSCHAGAYLGASMFQRAGIAKPWPSAADQGRFQVTKDDVDRMMFKVPSLRNIDKTAPYFHDGSVGSLEAAVKAMADNQLGRQLTGEEAASIVAWLRSLTGEIPADYIKQPAPPPSTPRTPKADRS